MGVTELPDTAKRKAWMGLLARAPEGRLTELLASVDRPETTWLRPPEVGSVMVQGRVGGTGAAFNLGEMTVTRCSLRLSDGTVGHGYVQGRSKPASEAAAIVDALMQTGEAANIDNEILDVLRAEEAKRNSTRQEKAAATKVDFFTMVRGEDKS